MTPSPAPTPLSPRTAIELLVLDVDGVLTDGRIILDDQGIETKQFHVRDGAGIAMWRSVGKRVAILSGRRAAVVDRRAAELGISPVIQASSDKKLALLNLLDELALQPSQAAFMGDDLPDLPALTLPGLGLSACPDDAVPDVRARVAMVTAAAGGQGAVRELVESILRSENLWTIAVAAWLPGPNVLEK